MQKKGFTLIELCVVIAIIGSLSAIGIPSIISWMTQQSLQSAVYQISSDLFQARSLAIKNNANCQILYDPSLNLYTISLSNQTRNLSDYRGGVTFTPDPAVTEVQSPSITYDARGLCSAGGGQVFITNSQKTHTYRIQTSAAGGISTNVWVSGAGKWVRY